MAEFTMDGNVNDLSFLENSVGKLLEKLDDEIRHDISETESKKSDETIIYDEDENREINDNLDGTLDTSPGKAETESNQDRSQGQDESQTDSIPCLVCGAVFPDKDSLDDHIVTCQKKKKNEKKSKLHTCPECKKSYLRKDYLTLHMKRHSEPLCICEMCGRKFAVEYDLKQHIRTHTKEKPFQCEACGQTFSIKASLKLHYKRKHGRVSSLLEGGLSSDQNWKNYLVDKPHICDKCGKSFAEKSYLIAHKKRHIQSKDRPLKCEVCQKGFLKQAELNSHMRTHNGEKPFQCPVCHETFHFSCDLKRHAKKHTGKIMYPCHLCNKSFTTRYYVRQHYLRFHGEECFQESLKNGRIVGKASDEVEEIDDDVPSVEDHEASKRKDVSDMIDMASFEVEDVDDERYITDTNPSECGEADLDTLSTEGSENQKASDNSSQGFYEVCQTWNSLGATYNNILKLKLNGIAHTTLLEGSLESKDTGISRSVPVTDNSTEWSAWSKAIGDADSALRSTGTSKRSARKRTIENTADAEHTPATDDWSAWGRTVSLISDANKVMGKADTAHKDVESECSQSLKLDVTSSKSSVAEDKANNSTSACEGFEGCNDFDDIESDLDDMETMFDSTSEVISKSDKTDSKKGAVQNDWEEKCAKRVEEDIFTSVLTEYKKEVGQPMTLRDNDGRGRSIKLLETEEMLNDNNRESKEHNEKHPEETAEKVKILSTPESDDLSVAGDKLCSIVLPEVSEVWKENEVEKQVRKEDKNKNEDVDKVEDGENFDLESVGSDGTIEYNIDHDDMLSEAARNIENGEQSKVSSSEKTSENLAAHMKKHKEDSAEKAAEAAQKHHQMIDKSWPCSQCSKSFAKKNYLVAHMKRHNEERPLSCEVCGKGFVKNSELKVHMRLHNGVRPYQCDICGDSFSLGCNLKRHMTKHTNHRPYKCTSCEKGFRTKYELTRHNTCLHDDAPGIYLCNVCGKDFKMKKELDVHTRIHSGEKPFTCEYCGKAFRFENSFANHRKLHREERPFTCEICGKGFVCRGDLRRHSGIHEEKTLLCHICNLSFSLEHRLKSHLKKHSFGTLVCQVCFAECRSVTHLRDHMKRKHPDPDKRGDR